jgi:hypothetical protein
MSRPGPYSSAIRTLARTSPSNTGSLWQKTGVLVFLSIVASCSLRKLNSRWLSAVSLAVRYWQAISNGALKSLVNVAALPALALIPQAFTTS